MKTAKPNFGLKRLLLGFALFSLPLAIFAPYGLIPAACGVVAGIGAFGLALTVDQRHTEYLLYVAIPTTLGGLLAIALTPITMSEVFRAVFGVVIAAVSFALAMIGARRAGIPQGWTSHIVEDRESNEIDESAG